MGQMRDHDGYRIAKGGQGKFVFLIKRQYERTMWPKSKPLTRVIHAFAEGLRKDHRLADDRWDSDENEEKYQLKQISSSQFAEIIKIFDDALTKDHRPSNDVIRDKQQVQKE